MVPTQLANAILAAANPTSVKSLAQRCGLSPSTLSKLVSTPRRIDVDTLRALCTRSNPDAGLKLLLAHLHDEVERAGRAETEMLIARRGPFDDDDLSVLADELVREQKRGGEELYNVVHDLAELVRGYRRRMGDYPERVEDGQYVASPPPQISPRKRRK